MKKISFIFYSMMLISYLSVAQNVGIGVTNPAFKLDVMGRIRVKAGTLGNVSTSSGLWFDDYRDGSNRIFFGMQDSMRVGLYGTGTGGVGWAFNFHSQTGNVGIGVPSANSKLSVNGEIGLYNGTAFRGALSVNNENLVLNAERGSILGGVTRNLILQLSADGIFPITAGNVGIGTGNPGNKLHVAAGSATGNSLISPFGQLGVENNNHTYVGLLAPDNKESGIVFGIGSNTTSGAIIYNNSASQYGLSFTTFNNSTRMVITGLGNVGIGTQFPGGQLEVASAGASPQAVLNQTNGSDYARLRLVTGNTPTLGRFWDIGGSIQNMVQGQLSFVNDQLNFYHSYWGNMITLSALNGCIGIGTSSPNEKLHVIGNIKASGTITPSDMRYKKDIQPLAGSLNVILSLQGVNYYMRYKDFPILPQDDTKQIGLIAQQVEIILPEVVHTDANGYKGIDYPKIIPVLIEAIKEQQKQILQLTQQSVLIKNLEKEIELLKKKVN